MSHPEIDNRTPFAFAPVFAADEEGRPLVSPLVKATYELRPSGALELAAEQAAPDFVGEYHGEPGASSCRFEPELAFLKQATDVVLVGHAHAPSRGTTSMEVSLRLGPVRRTLRVSGDRVWRRRILGAVPTDPRPFEKIPLVYERAYGGWDRSQDDPGRHVFHPGNPVGVGFRGKGARFEEDAPLPNIEDPAHLLTRYAGKSRPASFGFTCPHWTPRSALAGTYDDAWQRTRMPLLPRDFDRRFFNAASPGLVAPGHLRGDEAVSIRGASPERELSFRLPGVGAPTCRLMLRGLEDALCQLKLDTVILDLDERKLFLLWRTFAPLREGPLDVLAMQINAENLPQAKSPDLPENVVSLAARRAA